MEFDSFSSRRWFYLILGTLAMLCMGSVYGWSALKAPLSDTFGWSASELALTYSLCFCTFCIGSFLGSALSSRIGHRLTIGLGALFFWGGFVLTASLHTSAILYLHLFFGCFVGFGLGLAYPVLLSWIGAWFPDHPGLCSGILMMGFGCSALIIAKPASMLFDVPSVGWRGAYILLGTCAGAALLLCALFFRGQAGSARPADASVQPAAAPEDLSPRQMLRTGLFWKFFFYGILVSGLGTSVFAVAYDFCLDLGAGVALASTLVGLLSAFNGVSRIFIGFLYDRIGVRRTMLFGTLLAVAAPVLLIAAIYAHSLLLGAAGLALTGLSYGYTPVIAATCIRTFFGQTYFSANYSLNNAKLLLTSFYSPIVASLYLSFGSFTAPFVLLLILGIIACLLVTTIRPPRRGNDTNYF